MSESIDLGMRDISVKGSQPELIILRDALNAAIAGGAGCTISFKQPKQLYVYRIEDLSLCSKCGVRLYEDEDIKCQSCIERKQ